MCVSVCVCVLGKRGHVTAFAFVVVLHGVLVFFRKLKGGELAHLERERGGGGGGGVEWNM